MKKISMFVILSALAGLSGPAHAVTCKARLQLCIKTRACPTCGSLGTCEQRYANAVQLKREGRMPFWLTYGYRMIPCEL